MQERIWNLSNILSLSRIGFAGPIIVLLLHDDPTYRWWAIGLMILASLTDALDGYFARRLDQETTFGRFIDPLADKVVLGAVAAVLALQGDIPVWFLVAILMRDLLILSGGWYVRKLTGLVLPSNWPGKIVVSIVALVLILAAMPLEELQTITLNLMWLSTIMLFISFVLYARRFFALLGNRRGA